MLRGIWRRLLSYSVRKIRNLSSSDIFFRMASVHPYFSLLFLLIISYTFLISLFHLYDIRLVIQAIPSRPYNRFFNHLGHYPKFSFQSYCKGCENLLLNGYQWKIISSIDFLIMVPSAANNFEQRQRVRNTWGSAPSTYKDKRVFFFLGIPTDETIQEDIETENLKFGDIVQANFIDTYYNLTYKSLSMLYWAHYRMSDGRFRPKWILKCDDDNFMDIFQVETYMHTFDRLQGSHIICSKREEAVPSRVDKNSTWFVDFDTWPEPLWPPCCFGPAYFLTPEAVGKLLAAHEAANNPFLPFEDIYITGVLARAAGVSIINFDDRIFTNYLGKEKLIIHKGLSHWKRQYMEERWEDTMIAWFGNDTYQRMKAEERAELEMVKKQALIQDLVTARRKAFFAQKNQTNPKDVEKPSAPKKMNNTRAKREQALKKPVQPYLF